MSEAALAKATARKPKTRFGRKLLRDREPQAIEGAKTALIMRGNKSTADVMTLLRDLYLLRTPLATLYSRKHPEHPFEDVAKLETICKQLDHSLFAFGSSSKKRPFRLILGRLFDAKLLDMQEFRVEDFRSIRSFGARKEASAGSKPLVIFQGSAFETDERAKRVKSLLLDFFGGARPQKVALLGLEQVVVCSVTEESGGATEKSPPKVSVARYHVDMEKSGSRLPRVELEEVGPRFRLVLDRTREPDKERWKQAIKVAKTTKPKKEKSIAHQKDMGKKRGQLHLGKQDFDQIHTVHHSKRKAKKLRADMGAEGGSGGGAADA
uniref:Ribosome production factor 2 homolog n=1 Tax=Alexandrium andersonii TaxID=327968 RepID=A0A7S2J5H0_9DINO|mmetsp:Transcript_94462/g.211765  ORF Transcript_94462/g.211765 Transcript_94462/m.211765 type:complete len:323 (+) Transcript_94462:61-1029(+)